MAVNYNPQIVTNGLILCLDAANIKSYPGSGTTWTDLSTNSNNGTLTNGPTFSSANGGSIVFDGIDDYAQCSANTSVTTATFLVWMYRNGSQVDFTGILMSRGATANGLNFNGTSNQIGYHWNSDANAHYWGSGLTVPNLTWCMIAVSVSTSSATAYLCQSSGITTATNILNHPSVTLSSTRVGYDINFRYFKGQIAQALIYNRGLTADEVAQNFNATRGRFGV